nr:nonstructural protein p7 [Classical swine fever virus]
LPLGQGEVVLIGNLITHTDIEVVVYFLLLYLVMRDEPIKKWILLLFHAMTNNPVKTITVALLMVSGVAKG